MPRSTHGGREELGQNFLTHKPTIKTLVDLIAHTEGPILEIGAGDGALTKQLARLGRPITAIDIDEHRVARLKRALPHLSIKHADALKYPLDEPVIVGNIPFHITTPILRRVLAQGGWQNAFLLTQWEVARKRAGVGGNTMMSAQAGAWFTFTLHARVPSWAFTPRPSVDGGILQINRRATPLVPQRERKQYEQFVGSVFTARGGTLKRMLGHVTGAGQAKIARALGEAKIQSQHLPRDLSPEQWSLLWQRLR